MRYIPSTIPQRARGLLALKKGRGVSHQPPKRLPRKMEGVSD